MKNPYEDFYIQIKDRNGASASVYILEKDDSKIVYEDSSGKKFYEELFAAFPLEVVERYAIDWAQGKRKLDWRKVS